MADYLYWYALDHATDPWEGPFRSNVQARLASGRDGNRTRVRFIRSGLVLGPGSWMEVGVERIEPEVT